MTFCCKIFDGQDYQDIYVFIQHLVLILILKTVFLSCKHFLKGIYFSQYKLKDQVDKEKLFCVTLLGSRMVKDPTPGRTRDFKISVPVAVAFTRHTDACSRLFCPWSPHSRSCRSYRLAFSDWTGELGRPGEGVELIFDVVSCCNSEILS